jgi:Tol biopolymer transport system component
MFSVSDLDDGALAFRGGAGTAGLAPVFVDATGRPMETFDAGDTMNTPTNPAISPDGTRIAIAVGTPGARDIWTIDLARKARTRLTFDPGDDDNPVWSPDGKSIAFSSNRGGQNRVFVKPADGSADERLLSEHSGIPTSWSRDGRFLLVTSGSPTTQSDIWAIPNPGQPGGEAKPAAVLATPFNEANGQFSPDGRWIAYTSNESGVPEVYVRPFSATSPATGGAKWLVSVGGGISNFPRWSSTGRQLFFIRATTFDLQIVDIDTSQGFQAGTPRRLFSAPPPAVTGWAPASDDKRFLFITTSDGGRTAPFTVILNWAAAVNK